MGWVELDIKVNQRGKVHRFIISDTTESRHFTQITDICKLVAIKRQLEVKINYIMDHMWVFELKDF